MLLWLTLNNYRQSMNIEGANYCQQKNFFTFWLFLSATVTHKSTEAESISKILFLGFSCFFNHGFFVLQSQLKTPHTQDKKFDILDLKL